jgi:16S rRNA (cytosine967-C5)-methyltransferase
MDNSRKIALNVVEEVLDKGAYSNIILGNKLNKSRLDDRDKALVTEIVYGTLKYKYSIDVILGSFLKKGVKSLDNKVLNILRICIYQIKYLDKIPDFAVVNEGVNLAKKYVSVGASKLVNGVLRNYLRNKDKNYFKDNNVVETMCFNYSFPRWMVKLFVKQYGLEKCEIILKGLNERPSVTIRVNSMKTEYDDAVNNLKQYGYEIDEGYICPEAIRINKGKSVEQNPLFKEGHITVQDESAMLVATCMDLQEGMNVLDLCSAPGGKTTHIAELMNNTGKVKAFDISKNKLNLIRENALRLDITSIECSVSNAEKFKEEYEDSADRVLIDVPCSGLGIIRKKPEIKWNKNKKDLTDLVAIQKNILKNASKYVKKDGYIVYSTCTLNKDENKKNILWFLKNHSGFKIEPIFFGNADNIIYHEEGCATILPNEFMDGFFICKIKRVR